MTYRRIACAAALMVLAGCALTNKPQGQGPQWVERPASDVVDTLGKPDRVVRLPLPSMSTVYLYTGGAEPGYAVCQHDYFVRGGTVIGYSEHGTDPKCNRRAGRTE